MNGFSLLTFSFFIFFLLSVGVIFLFGIRKPYVVSTGIKFLKRSVKLNLALVLATCIGTMVITGSLIAGDSLRESITDAAYENLNEVDEVITSDGLFNGSIAQKLNENISLMEAVDHIAPIIYMKGIVGNPKSGAVTGSAYIIGYDDDFLDFGHLKTDDDKIIENVPDADEVFINEILASELDLSIGDRVNLSFSRLDQVYEAVFLGNQKNTNFRIQLTVSEIVQAQGLGRFQLNANRRAPQNVYISLETLQAVIGTQNGVNSILVSNTGDEKKGAESCSEVSLLLKNVLDDILGFEDAGLTLSENQNKGYIKLGAKDVFFSYEYYELLSGKENLDFLDASSPCLTYFFNSLTFENRSIFYSTVTALDPYLDAEFGMFKLNGSSEYFIGKLDANEIIINNWAAERLGVDIGDMVSMNYSIMDDFYNIKYLKTNFTVKYIVDMVGKVNDSMLMLSFPGIEGKMSAFDWDPPFPIELDKITDDDEKYWQTYGGSPKAFIGLEAGIALWKTDLGNITQIKMLPNEASNQSALADQIENVLNEYVGTEEASITIKTVKSDALNSVEGIELFTQMFLAFGATCIIASTVLIVLLITLRIENRMTEIGTLRALGFKIGTINHIFLVEGSTLSIIGGVFGVILGLLFGFFLIGGMNSFWSSIVEESKVDFFYTNDSLLMGFTSGIFISIFTMAVAIHHEGKKTVIISMKQLPYQMKEKKGLYLSAFMFIIGLIMILLAVLFGIEMLSEIGLLIPGLSPVILIISARGIIAARKKENIDHLTGLAIVVYTLLIMYFFVDYVPAMELFFVSGFMLLCGFLFVFYHYLWKIRIMSGESIKKSVNIGKKWLPYFAVRNAARRPKRTMFTVFLFSLTLFVLVSLTINLQGVVYDVEKQVAEGGGGYQIMGESTTPIFAELGDEDSRMAAGISSQVFHDLEIEQFKTKGGVGGTCSNLNRQASPRIIGANESFFYDNSFVFISNTDSREDNPWLLLGENGNNGDIPAIGDYNTVVWILGLELGSTISVVNEKGEMQDLKIVGIIGNSIFQGSLIIWEKNFDLMYPTKGGYELFLFKSETDDIKTPINELERALAPYGLDAYSVESRVIENIQVENTYISIFQALLLLGLIIGTFGFGIVASRNALERRREIGILRSIGFSRSMIFKSLWLENSYIVLWGLIIGALAGILASSIYLVKININIASWPWIYVLAILAGSYLVAISSTFIPIYNSAKMSISKAIRISE